MARLRVTLLALPLLCAACGTGATEVDRPFYLASMEGQLPRLVRCPDGPDRGCASDGLPGAAILAAGADARFVVVQSNQGYYYFARVPNEARGWGNAPERIVGPLDARAFAAAAARLDLPPLDVTP